MNNKIRKEIRELIEEIESINYQIQEIKDTEEEKLFNIPENLQYSERYERQENTVESLEEAINCIEETISNLQEAIEN